MKTTPGRVLLAGGVIAYVAILLLAPIGAIAWSALREGPSAFLRALAGSGGGFALLLSIALAAVAVVVNTIFGVVIAWVLTRDSFRGRSLANAAVDMPFAISPVIVGFALILLFGPQGWFGGLVRALHIKVVFALPGMALATIFVSLPFVIREVGLVLAESGHDQEEAAYTLGATRLGAFFRITLPNIRWGLLYGILLTTARCLGEFGAVLVVSGGLAQVTETGTLFVFRSLEDRRDLGAYAMALALAGLSILLIAGMEILKRRQASSNPSRRGALRIA
jgi:sulfate transport system permease protein